MMFDFDIEKRKDEIRDIFYHRKCEWPINDIIESEQKMIEQVKKEEREEFVKELKLLKSMNRDFYIDILLERYEETK